MSDEWSFKEDKARFDRMIEEWMSLPYEEYMAKWRRFLAMSEAMELFVEEEPTLTGIAQHRPIM